MGMGVLQGQGAGLARQCYVDAAASGWRGWAGMLLGEGVLTCAVARGTPLAERERSAVARELRCHALPQPESGALLRGGAGLPAEG